VRHFQDHTEAGWHGFRRGLASNLNRLGVDDAVIQAILRHSTVAITQACYIKTARVDAVAEMRQLCAALKSSNCSPLCAPEKERKVQQAVQSDLCKLFPANRVCGGGRGIRTPGTVSRTAVFKTARFNRSRIPPRTPVVTATFNRECRTATRRGNSFIVNQACLKLVEGRNDRPLE